MSQSLNASSLADRGVWIFGYASLLAPASGTKRDIPCRLKGWSRNWSATRVSKYGDRKRFVNPISFEVIREYAFASIEPKNDSIINGVASWVDLKDLHLLDFREQGYRRLDVTSQIESYDGVEIAGKVETYVDFAHELPVAPVSFEYVNMGIRGAAQLDKCNPGFLQEFCATTPLPTGLFHSMGFIYIGVDGRTIWLLHMNSGAKTLLALLPQSIIPDAKIPPESTIDWQIPCPQDWQAYDFRYKFDDVTFPLEKSLQLEVLSEAIWGEFPQNYLDHPCWLVRLGCLCGANIKRKWVEGLLSDPDAWVSRAAKAILSSRV